MFLTDNKLDLKDIHTKAKYGLVIPCYNESASVLKLIKECNNLLDLHEDLRILIVENGSLDDTRYHISRTVKSDSLYILELDVNLGYGGGIKKGLDFFHECEYLGYTHADLQTPLSDISRAISLIDKSRFSFCKGVRLSRPALDEFFSSGMGLIASISLGLRLKEINAQPTVFKMEFYRRIRHLLPDDFGIDLYIYYYSQREQLSTGRLKVEFPPRQYGASSWNDGTFSARMKFVFRALSNIYSLKKQINDIST